MACMKSSSAASGSVRKPVNQGRAITAAIDTPVPAPAPSYPDNVDPRDTYPLQAWAQRMSRLGILSDMGFYSLTYPDGKVMVQDVLQSLGWSPVTNYRSLHPFQPVFFWCHSYTAKDVTEWRQQSRLGGALFVSSLPNIGCLHNKKVLQQLIRRYELAVLDATGRDAPAHLRFPGDIREYSSDNYLPRTLFDLTPEELRHIANACFTRKSLWIAKPLSQNCGRGIGLIRSREQLLELESRLPNVIIQEYIRNPVTLDGRKSDMRVYLLLVCPERGHLMAFYHPGFVRLSLRPYDEQSDDLAVHLTNQSVAKTTEEWARQRDQSTWTPAQMNDHLNTTRRDGPAFQRDHLFKQLHPAMRTILSIVSRAAFPKVTRVGGCFEFLGCDFMVDTNGQVWLIEINCYPGMATSTSLLKRLKPQIVHEAICLSMECISKQYQGKSMQPLESLRQFQLLWNSADS